ncbi:MAG: hypothetical protein GKR92_01100 [Gammaproteobacteria bacterium]|nr:MAG: hypothetical protein GKR92_01100 [Gammaproteobacteria bacterium]
MAVFDKFKQWVEKTFETTQSSNEQVLDEQYQEQIDVETPREELFKQNILMGDTGRSEIIGEETASENIATSADEFVPARNIEQEQGASSEQNQNEINIPDFLKADNDSDLNTANAAQPFSNDQDLSSVSGLDATQFNSTPVPNDFVSSSSVGTGSNFPGDSGNNIIPDPVPISDLSPVYDSDTTANSVNESASAGTSVGVTAFADDPDSADTVSYSLSSNPGNAFAINTSTGEVTVANPGALDFETNATMQIQVTATSSDGSSSNATFDISIGDDVDEFDISAVTDSDTTANSVNESASAGTSVGVTAFADDPDSADTVSYSLSSNPGNAFAINTSTGEVTVANPGALDFETNATMQIQVTATSSDGSSSNATFDISIGDDVDEFDISAVTDSDTTANSVNESASAGTSVGVTAFADDPDSADTVSYSLSSNPGNAFAINTSTGEVTVANPGALDFETNATMQIQVTATSSDGSSSNATFDISIGDDVDEFDISAVTDSDTTANSVNESASAGTSVGVTAFADDPDSADTVSYSLSSNPGNAFAINTSTGEVTVANPGALDFETNATMQIQVTATSSDGSSSNATFDISIGDDVDEFDISAVTDSDTTANSVNESASAGTSVGVTAFADDPDSADTVSYSLSSNPGNAFAINTSTGEVTVANPGALDFETNATMQIQVTATSSDGSSSNATFDIAIEDINEGVVVTTNNVNGNEDSAIALNIQLSSVEQGSAVAITISGVPTGSVLSAGVDNNDGTWTLDQTELSGLTLTPPENSDTDFSLAVQTTVTEDGVTLTYNNTFNVNVDAVADAPMLVGPNTITHLQNPATNFEGGLGNVDVLGTVNNPNSFQGQNPTEGASIAQLLASGATDAQVEAELGLAAGSLDVLSPGNATDGSSMQTAIAVQEGDVITFDWNFYNAENAGDIGNGFNDFAIVNINGTPQGLSQSSNIGNPGATGWQTFTFTATEDGVLDLGFAVMNTRDQAVDSSLLVDNLEINGSTVDTRPVDLNLAIALVDNDGSESIEIEISGVPADASLSAGTNLGSGVWSVDQNDVDGLQLVPSATTSGTVSLTVSATSTEANGGDTATVTQNVDVVFETLDGPMFGTLGNDNITGTANDDVIVARDGNDVIAGGDGDDLIVGGAGNDILNGDAGNDQIYGGDGNDSLNGGDGNDILIGGAGNDAAVGGAGDDVYVFEALGDTDSFSGGNGGGWTDVVSLDVDISSLPNPADPWTVTVGGNEVSYDVALGYLDLGTDAAGSITFDDGSTLNFDGVEGIEW